MQYVGVSWKYGAISMSIIVAILFLLLVLISRLNILGRLFDQNKTYIHFYNH